MNARACFMLLFTLLLAGCGVKNDLEIPSGRPPAADERDSSRPPQPLGQ
jgi:predicted small lipoprotein YifL